MNTYEAFVILKPILDMDNSDTALKNLEEQIDSLGGKIVKKDKLGRKRLAYELNKFKDGFIATYLFKLEASAVENLRRFCQLNEDILRVALINRNNVDMTDASIFGRERQDHRGERSGGEQREFTRRPHARVAAD